MKFKTKTLIRLLPLAVLFLIAKPAHSQQKASVQVQYEDYDAWKARLTPDLESLIKDKRTIVGVNGLKEKAKHINEHDKVTAVLPKQGTEKITPEEIYQKRKSGSLLIGRYFTADTSKARKAEFMASGIVLTEDGICASNYHVFSEIINGGVFGVYDAKNMDSLRFVATGDGKMYLIEKILSYNQKADLAIFKLDTKGDRLSPIPFGNPALVGATAHLIANPSGNLFYFSTGIVNRNTANNSLGSSGNRMEISADFAKGSSGGPVIDDQGNLIGMVSSTKSIYYQDSPQQNFQMILRSCIPAEIIKNCFK